jgi:hypothetical protein
MEQSKSGSHVYLRLIEAALANSLNNLQPHPQYLILQEAIQEFNMLQNSLMQLAHAQ